MIHPTTGDDGATGLAALSICESLLLSLTELKILGDGEARVILEDAAEAHRKAIPTATNREAREEAIGMIERIIKGTNSVRHS